MDYPLVSIITPVLNGRRYLEECIQSVLRQSYQHTEHVFVDGGSSDGTVGILADYRAKYPHRIRFISEPDRGLLDAWMKCARMAAGDVFGSIGADDIYEPEAIEAVVEFFRLNPDAYFVHGDCDRIDEDGELIGQHKTTKFDFDEFVNTARHISTTSAFYRRAAMDAIGWPDTAGDDFELKLQIAKRFRIYDMPRVLSRLRVRNGSAFNPGHFEGRRKMYELMYRTSRKYGGQRWSPIGRRYFAAVIADSLHLGSQFLALREVCRRLREGDRQSSR